MANIVNVRLDERLIHGQIGAFWTNELKANRLMVIDDIAAGNEIQKTALKMAKPAGTKLSILKVDKAVERLNDPEAYVGERLFVICGKIKTINELIKKGAPIKKVTIGNISNKTGSTRIYSSVSVSHEEAELFRETAKLGIEFTAQMVPNDEPKEFIPLIKNI